MKDWDVLKVMIAYAKEQQGTWFIKNMYNDPVVGVHLISKLCDCLRQVFAYP